MNKLPEDIRADFLAAMPTATTTASPSVPVSEPTAPVDSGLPVYDATPDPMLDTLRRLDLRSHLAQHHNIRVNGNGLALCPFHNDTAPSFSVYQKDGLWKWKCHGKCNVGGDILDFYVTFKEMSLPEAIKTARELEGIAETVEPSTPNQAPAVVTGKKATVVLQSLSSVTSRETFYIMQDRIPQGMFTVLAGEGGVGKSTFLTEVACRLSKGDPLPGSKEPLVPAGSTIYITTENQPEEVFRPRAIACGGDLSKIYYARNALVPVGNDKELQVIDIGRHLPALAERIQEIGDVRLVAIDPCISHVPKEVDDWRAKPVRQLLDILNDFAAKHAVSTVGVIHNIKAVASSAKNKVSGSNQWVNAARMAIGIAPDKEDPDGTRYLLSVIKANVYASRLSLAFRIINTPVVDPDAPTLKLRAGRPVFEAEELDIDIEALFNPERREESMTVKAVRLFNNELKAGPRPAEEIWAMAQLLGITEGSYKHARKKRGIVAEKLGGKFGRDDGEEKWVLWLPELWDAYQQPGGRA